MRSRALVAVASLLALATLIRSNQQCLAIMPQNHASKPSRRAVLSLAGALSLSPALLWKSQAASADSLVPPQSKPLIPGSRVNYQPTGEGLSWTPPPLTTKLGNDRIGASELSPLIPKLSPFADQELYYAPFFFGSWNVTATLKRKLYPYGTDVLPSKSLIEGSPRNRQETVGDPGVAYQLDFFSTLADTVANQVTVNLGLGVPKSRIIADRAFSAKSISRAYQQLTPVQDVVWDPSRDPTRLTLSFGAGPVADDMRPLGQRRTEIYITARDSEQVGNNVFCAAERNRIVMLSPGNVVVSDTETITEYRLLDPDTISATSRIAVFLTPNPNSREGVLWQQLGGKAVAFFDYELQMKRNEETFLVNGKETKRACVTTPKDVIQCA